MAKFSIQDSTGAVHKVDVNLSLFQQASVDNQAHGLRALDTMIQTREDQPLPSQQVYAHVGFTRPGLTMGQAMQLTHGQSGGAIELDGGDSDRLASTQDGSVTGRLVTQAYLMDAIESSLRASDYGIQALFTRKAAVTDSINGTRFERPILDFTKPASVRSKAIAELSEPTRMLLLTTSSKSFRIAGTSIGIEYSDQVANSITIPIVTLSMQRQAEEEAFERIEDQLLAFLNGDADLDMPALSAVSGAVRTAASFDSTIVAAGVLTQNAWVSWLFNNSRRRRIDTVITDLAGALAIQNRTGRPTVQGDNATSPRIDTLDSIVNPTWPDQVDVIISQDPNWPANTLVGFDSRYGYHIVTSTTLAYSAIEQFAIRRSTKMRVDQGSIAYRLFDDAWTVLTLTV